MELVDRLHGAQEDLKIEHEHVKDGKKVIHAAEQREKAAREAEEALKIEVARDEKAVIEKEAMIKRDEAELKEAHGLSQKLAKSLEDLKT